MGGDVFFFPEDVLNTSKQAEKGSVMENGAISLDILSHPVDILPVIYLPIFCRRRIFCAFLWIGNRLTLSSTESQSLNMENG